VEGSGVAWSAPFEAHHPTTVINNGQYLGVGSVHSCEPKGFAKLVFVDADDGQVFGNLDAKLSCGRETANSDLVRARYEHSVHPLEHRKVVKKQGSLFGAVTQAKRSEVTAGARKRALQKLGSFTTKPAVNEWCDHGNFFKPAVAMLSVALAATKPSSPAYLG